jgi:predicted enzyme related to lactoylglutathione lyase
MSERDGYIPGVPCWVDTRQPDPKSAAAFYRDLFGWDVEEAADPEYTLARIRGGDVAGIAPAPDEGRPDAVWNTYVAVASADEVAAAARAAGGQVVMEPFDLPGSGRMAVIADTEGAVLSVWEAKEFAGARVVNEHGALVFNGLATRDIERAKAFYGAVFGWGVLPGGLMWTRPGYGDHLEERMPGLREQMTQMGAPDGFVDVVAAVEPIADGDTETPAHWSVTFATEDVDTTATKAQELGATVVAGPFDAPWTRMAVIRDPQGATFIASQFVPENKDLPA